MSNITDIGSRITADCGVTWGTSKFLVTSAKHVCAEPYGHTHDHKCACGARCCIHCGPDCKPGAAHNARTEDNVRWSAVPSITAPKKFSQESELMAEVTRLRIENGKLQSQLNDVDEILLLDFIPNEDGDYKTALHKLIQWNILLELDPATSPRADAMERLYQAALACITRYVMTEGAPDPLDAELMEAVRIYLSQRYDTSGTTFALPGKPASHSVRAVRNAQIHRWGVCNFGHEDMASIPQRGIRFYEESTEAIQAAGLTREQAHFVVNHVFDHPVGELSQELGGVGVTLLALAYAANLDADICEEREICRILSKSCEHWKARNAAKKALGLNAMEPTKS